MPDLQRRTVYVLGAGFSIDAGVPPQGAILGSIFNRNDSDFSSLGHGSSTLLLDTESSFGEARSAVKRFLMQAFFPGRIENSDQLASDSVEGDSTSVHCEGCELSKDDLDSISLEDVFTAVDKALMTGDSLLRHDVRELSLLREHLLLCIVRVFARSVLAHKCDRYAYEVFAQHLVDTQSRRGDGESVAVVTTNWDCVLDMYLDRVIGGRDDIGIDYGVVDHDHRKCDPSWDGEWCPSAHLGPRGKSSVKLLKLHGAINWLICPNCRRLFYSHSTPIALYQFIADSERAFCAYCRDYYPGSGHDPSYRLTCNIATPTMVKNLTDINLRDVWRDTFLELSIADRVVFIGYSFPFADYEFRYLLLRALRSCVDIEVVLAPHDDPEHYEICDPEDRRRIAKLLPSYRYESFFGAGRVQFHYGGFCEYVNNHL